MRETPLHIWLLSDDRPGHVNLSRGAIAALARNVPVEVYKLSVTLRVGLARTLLRFLLNRLKAVPSITWLKAFYAVPELPSAPCDLIVSAGGKTSFANAWLANRLEARNIFIGSLRRLKPDLFDVVVTMEAIGQNAENNLVLDLPPCAIEIKKLEHQGRALRKKLELEDARVWVCMTGGDGAGYRYAKEDWHKLIAVLERLGEVHSASWLVLGSRRTPHLVRELLQGLVDKSCVAAAYWAESSHPETVEACLGAAERVFVTEDSMTMLAEAIYSERPVISLRPEKVVSSQRYADMVERFVAHGWMVRETLSDLAENPRHLTGPGSNIRLESPLENLAFELAQRLDLDSRR